ncbi:hypothetical protein Tco_1317945 [Tanacetum coccineum]
MSSENKENYQSEKEAIHLLLTGIGDEIYSTVDACKTAHDMWIAIERLQQEVNEIRAKRKAKNANPLALVAAAQQYPDPYYQAPKSHKPYAPTSKQSSSTRSNASTKFKGKEIAKPITPSSETSSNSRNKNVDTTPRYKNDNQTGQFRNQRTVTVAGARETVGSQVQNNAEYNVFANVRQHSEQPESTINTCLVETDDSNVIPDSPDMCDNDIQTDQNAKDEHAPLANLIANLKLDVDENKKIQKQLKKANASLAHEWKECKSILAKTSRTLGESNSIRDSCLITLQNKQIKFERYKALNDHIVDYDKLEHKLNETLGLLGQKETDIKEGLKLEAYEISVVKEKHDELVKQSLLTKSHYEGLVKEKTKAATLEKQMNAKLAWIHEKYNHRSETHIGGSSSQTHEIGDVYLTAEELHQLHIYEEALRETLKEQTMDEKAREDKIRQKQADDDEYFMEFGVMRIDSDYESSD